MTKEEIINEINCLLSELDNGEDAVSYLTQNDVNWLNENIKALEQEPCEDAVSRTEVLNLVRFNAFHVKSQIKAIENMPSVTPQEPKPMIEIDLCSAIKQKYIEREVLEKLRADIEAAYDELDGYDPDALGTFASRIDDLIDNLLSESEVKANGNEK